MAIYREKTLSVSLDSNAVPQYRNAGALTTIPQDDMAPTHINFSNNHIDFKNTRTHLRVRCHSPRGCLYDCLSTLQAINATVLKLLHTVCGGSTKAVSSFGCILSPFLLLTSLGHLHSAGFRQCECVCVQSPSFHRPVVLTRGFRSCPSYSLTRESNPCLQFLYSHLQGRSDRLSHESTFNTDFFSVITHTFYCLYF
jgi:hypothetical protein